MKLTKILSTLLITSTLTIGFQPQAHAAIAFMTVATTAAVADLFGALGFGTLFAGMITQRPKLFGIGAFLLDKNTNMITLQNLSSEQLEKAGLNQVERDALLAEHEAINLALQDAQVAHQNGESNIDAQFKSDISPAAYSAIGKILKIQ